MMRTLLLAVAIALTASPSPAANKTCPCSVLCSCGCNQGTPCNCNKDVKKAPKQPLAAPPKPEGPNFGVVREQLGKGPSCSWNGIPCDRQGVMQAIGNRLVDDTQQLRLTIIGPEDERKRFLADWDSSPLLAQWRTKIVVQAYDPSHWAIRDYGFRLPSLYVQRPDGVVLHRQDTYRGPEALAEALRKANPDYDPSRDPDLTKPSPIPVIADVPVFVWIAGGVGVLLLLRKESK